MNRIVYLVHGGEKYYIQARFSILSLLHFLLEDATQNVQILVATDRADKIPSHPLIQVLAIDSATLSAYKGKMNYVHRVKLKVLEAVQHDFGLPFIYVDCDTQWRRHPRDAFAQMAQTGVITMHEYEGELGSDFFPNYAKYAKQLMNGNAVPILELDFSTLQNPSMWNTGTIGVPATASNYIAQTLQLNDHMLMHTRPRYWVEQAALSLCAQARGKGVHLFNSYLLHFWPYGRVLSQEMQAHLDTMPPSFSIKEQARFCASLQLDEMKLRRLQDTPEAPFTKYRNKLRASLEKRFYDLKALFYR